MTSIVQRWADRPGQAGIWVLWATYTVGYLMFFVSFHSAPEIADAELDGYLEVVLLAIPSVVLLACAISLRETILDADLRRRIVGWSIGTSAALVAAFQAALFVLEIRFDTGEQWLILLLSAGFGAAGGAAIGIQRAHSLHHQREWYRSRLEKKRKERERKQLEYLNQYLRHEVLNEAQKIRGYVSLLQKNLSADGKVGSWLEAIERSNDEIADFVASIRTILEASDHEPDLAPVDVVPILKDQVHELRAHRGTKRVTIDGPDTGYVLAGDLVGRVFANLLYNAIEHNDEPVRISIVIERTDGWLTVRIGDDGSGISPEERADLFEPPDSGNHGYGLFLTNNLVELYGGVLELVDTGPEGTQFRVKLPAAGQPKTYSPNPMPSPPTRSA